MKLTTVILPFRGKSFTLEIWNDFMIVVGCASNKEALIFPLWYSRLLERLYMGPS
jgi:hypothetical protein